MRTLDCWGDSLPAAQFAECSEQVSLLEDCCEILQTEDEMLLWESQKGAYYYWLFLDADETPLAICALEKYVDHKSMRGRKADYLAIGWYHGECYIVIIELRKTLLKEEHSVNKIEQVKQSIEILLSDGLLAEIENSDFFSYACERPEYYHIVGVVIPSTRSKKRAQTRQKIIVNGKEYLVVAIPNSLIRQCRINWSELMRAIIG